MTTASSDPESRPAARAPAVPRALTVVAAVLLLIGTVVAVLVSRTVVRDQEHRLLQERAVEVQQFVSNSFGSVQSSLGSLGAVARVTDSSPSAFQEAAGAVGSAAALLRVAATGEVTEIASVGKGLPTTFDGPRAAAIDQAAAQGGLVTTTLLSQSATSGRLGIAVGGPQTPAGEVVYSEFDVPRDATGQNNAFSELDAALYVAPRADPHQLLIVSHGLPDGRIVSRLAAVGHSSWLIVVSARRPLVGSLAADAPWFLLAVGLLGTLLIASVMEVVARRRDYALELVDERTAELRASLAELNATQAQLVRHERLAAVGELASTVGHELRNPLGVITNSLYLIRNATAGSADERLTRQLSIAEREVAAATLIISDLLDFARAREPIVRSVDVGALVDEALDVAPAPTGVTVEWRPPEPSPTVAADRDQLRQVLLNLITNAYDAEPDGGTVKVAAQGNGAGVRITVADTGVGMDENTRARLFEPFFTTKARGTGLGLAVTERIVHAHGGSISVESTPGAGSTFTITLPAAADQ